MAVLPLKLTTEKTLSRIEVGVALKNGSAMSAANKLLAFSIVETWPFVPSL